MGRRDDRVGADLRTVGERDPDRGAVAHVDASDRRRRCGSSHRTTGPRRPSPASPRPCRRAGSPTPRRWPPVWSRWWCSVTNAVPALRGPPHVPITPETLSSPRIASDSNRSSTRSAMLVVNSRVRSNAARTSTLRSVRRSGRLLEQVARPLASRAWAGSRRAAGRRVDRGPASQRSQRSYASASTLENFDDLLVARGPGRSGRLQVAAVAAGREVRPLRVDVVAVLGQAQVAHHVGREQAHDVRQRGDREVGAERPLRHRGTADDVPALEDEHARPARARYAAATRPLWPPPITTTSKSPLTTPILPDSSVSCEGPY